MEIAFWATSRGVEGDEEGSRSGSIFLRVS